MESPSPTKTRPLALLTPERVNRRAMALSSPIRKDLPFSPSLPDFTVSGLVKRFEHLDVRDRDAEIAERQRKADLALERSQTAREEAEDEAKRSREELRAQKKELDESKDRERTACKRIDVLMDEFTRAKEQWSSQTAIYEKETRRARKEAFKSSSVVVKLQEEHKHLSKELHAHRTKLDLAQRKASQAEEEKFAAEYQLVAVQEELEKLQASLRPAQEERDALKKSLKEEVVAEAAANGMIALPEEPVPRQRLDPRTGELERHLFYERRKRRAAQELAQFLALECQFGCCHHATLVATRGTHPTCVSMAGRVNTPGTETAQEDTVLQHETATDKEMQDIAAVVPSTQEVKSDLQHQIKIEAEEQHVVDVAPNHLTENTRPSVSLADTSHIDHPSTVKLLDPSPQRESSASIRMITKTMKIPMKFSPVKRPDSPDISTIATPTTAASVTPITPLDKTYPFDREAALAAIAYRRGRAQSLAQKTPKKDSRNISAPIPG